MGGKTNLSVQLRRRSSDTLPVPWVRLRSRREPGVWVPLLAIALLLVPLAVVVQTWLSEWLAHLRELAISDASAAEAEAIRVLRLVAWSLCALTAGFSAYLFRYFQLGGREDRLPPSGWWSFGAVRALVGPQVRRVSQFGLVLSLVLLAAAVGLALSVEHLVCLVEAGRLAA